MAGPLQQTARDIMSAEVPTLSSGASVEDTVTLLADPEITFAIVVDAEQRPAGIVTEGDLLALAQGERQRTGAFLKRMLQEEHHVADTMRNLRKAVGTKVTDIMSAPVESVAPDAPIGRVAALMETYNQLPVVEEERLLGVITRQDIVRAIADRD